MHSVLIGYFPKKVTPRPEWLQAPAVREICSVSECIASGPEGWITHWVHNALGVYDTEQLAASIIPAGTQGDAFRLYAYRLLPILFRARAQEPLDLPRLEVQPLPETFVSMGFDVVSRSVGMAFECSPLSCNGMATQFEVNEHCLVTSPEGAVEVARWCAGEEPEPGPYVVVQVLRRAP
jgi:hypothetical protein